jgi:DNA mismatch repair protein MutS
MSNSSKNKTLTPMMKQYFEIKEKYPDGILFFRMGDFYEMFLEDAEKAAGPLEVALTKRNGMAMCGVPYHAKDNYIPKLLKAGFKIVVCDQLEDPKLAKGIVKRGVTEIITPGTITDSKFISSETNYLSTFMYQDGKLAIASVDISTGSFIALQEIVTNPVSNLRDEIARINPKEILVKDSYKTNKEIQKVLEQLKHNAAITYYNDIYYDPAVTYKIIKDQFKVANLKGFGIDDEPLLISVAGVLIRYLRQTQLRDISHINRIDVLMPSDYTRINETSIKHLELIESQSSKDNKTSLFNNINNTITNMGARLLYHSLTRPLIDEGKINARLDKVDVFYEDRGLLEEVREILKEISDLDRLIARLSLSKILPREVISLKDSIRKAVELKEVLEDVVVFDELLEGINDFMPIITRIEETILDECKNDFDSGKVVNPSYNEELAEHINIRKNGKQLILQMEEEEREKTSINNLKIAFNNVIGYYVQVSRGQVKNVPDYYYKRQSLKNSERYTFEKLSELEVKIKSAEEKMIALQKEIYEKLVSELQQWIGKLKDASQTIAEIDLFSNFAFTAIENKYTRPKVNTSKELKITGGRHPVVERMVEQYTFVANELIMNDKDSKLLIVTGPNMSGKSTYLRQNALIVIMAQMGSYVPTEEAQIGIIDSIFTRIGASDDLARGESTFLVEMIEAANILNNMTERSLIIMDEIGRGTSTYDGLSIAWSIVEYLTDKNIKNGKTLFATHYHELTVLAKEKGIRNLQVLVREWEDEIVFLHKVEDGSSSKSYGIQVARLAGVPQSVIDRAKELLADLEEQSTENQKRMLKPDRLKHPVLDDDGQLSLFQITMKMDPIRKEILKTDIDKLSPEKLLKWSKKLKKMAETGE